MPLPPPTVFAFFDVDDTLISIKSMFSFQAYWYAIAGDPRGRSLFEDEMNRLRGEQVSWEVLNRRYYAYFAGREVAAVERIAAGWFSHVERTTPGGLYLPTVVARLQAHKARGEVPVFVSGSFPALLAPVAARLGVEVMLATTLETAGGRYTGAILPPQTIGEGKAEAIRAMLARTGVAAECCYGYGDDISDLPMLLAVGHPIVVRGGRGLEAEGERRGWPLLAPREVEVA
ncbi:MAG TPA: HAD-IB family hydrolase [Patescibacteria group bacterium]|nr:HAD-IB family hydrolase [Patescibacteria group bacterium]